MSFSVSEFLRKVDDRDPDLRHMALYDLNTELQKDTFTINDDNTQRQVSDKVIEHLNDKTSDVQGMAVKCIAPLVKKMSLSQIQTTVKNVTSLVFGQEEKKDIATIAMKSVITELPSDYSSQCIPPATKAIVDGLKTAEVSVRLEAIDILTKILERFGSIVKKEHISIQSVLSSELNSSSSSVRKRTTTALATLCINSDDKLFKQLVEKLIQGIQNSEGDIKTYIQTVSAISRSAGNRLGEYLDAIVPLLVDSAVEMAGDEDENEDEADEVRENILQAYESMIQRCPSEITPYLEVLIDQCKQFIEYDPNYEEEDEDEDEDEEMETSDDDDEEEEEELFDDDEEDDLDISWKVRKAATKCLSAVARTRLDYLGVLYTELLDPEDPILIKRFKEREHRVKVDNLNTFADIVNASVIVSSGSTADGIPTVRQRSEAEKLKDIKDITIKYLRKQLKAKKDQVRNTIFTVLKSFTIALQGELGDNVPSFVNMLQTALNKKQQSNSTLKIEALNFLRLLLASHDPQVFKSHIKSLSDIACTGAQDKYFKITSESLKVCGQLVKVNAVTRGAPGFDESVQELFEAINNRLQTQDIDQDVKESAINSMGLLIAHLGDVIQSKLESCLNLLMERMKNEITRTTATKAFGNIAESSLEIDLSKILPDLVTYLADFLRKNDRTLKQATLTTLICIIVKYGNSISSKLYDKVISESVSLISDSDLQISHLALDMLSSIIDIHSASTNTVEKQILPKMLVLLQSSTLQGQALTSMQQLLGKMTSHVKFSDLLKAIVGVINQDSSKQVYNNVAKCVAVVIVNADAKSRNNEVESFIKSLKNTNDDNKKTLSLFCLGEIGISIDLSSHKSLKTEIESCFESGSEELKNAASFALGNVAVGNLEAYLPSILSEIQQKSKRKYLLLHSLKEIITRTPIDDLRPFNQQILPLLFEFTQVEEDGVRNIVAECLGKSALVDPESVFPMIKEALSSGNEHKRSTVVSAMKYTITEQEQKVDDMLNKDITTFTNLLTKSQPVSVRRAVILMINAAAHNKPKLLKDVIAETLPKIYEETPLDKSLIREIKLGPFTHKVDDGLDLRKATFECLDTLHDNCLEYIDPIPFIDAIKEGLSDRNQDIRMLTYIVLSKLCESSPGNLFSAVDQLVPPLEATLKKKLKENAVQQEKDRHEEEQRAVLRLVNSINVALKVNKADTIHSFDKLFTSVINANQELKAQYQQISGGDDIVPMEM
eukprot:gb/GECH01004564.1/.p1 GENE.gb/GECH01004564.1/~~gb/GECH01004564.1/.p1  ORF type:complete len:1232 (+),score=391.62 gb/GECH01004564.1/:1-3696(+)